MRPAYTKGFQVQDYLGTQRRQDVTPVTSSGRGDAQSADCNPPKSMAPGKVLFRAGVKIVDCKQWNG